LHLHPISLKSDDPQPRRRNKTIFKMAAVHFTYTTVIFAFPNSKWRLAAVLKIVYGYISTIYCAINAKFGMRKHDHV